MKIFHLSDLHLGKKLNEQPLIEDQEFILNQIAEEARKNKIDAVIIAGDIFDKSIATVEALGLFEEFLKKLVSFKIKVLIISGNHDSAERLSFGSDFMEASSIFISPAYDGKYPPVTLTDEYGEINFYLLPFIKPAVVRHFFPEENIESYTDAVRSAIKKMNPDFSKRNVMAAHQFITGAGRCESEEVSVGGLDNVDASVFDGFDYTALGHIHGPQNIGSEKVRYCGTPLKYSFSEINHKKSITVVELKEKGNVTVSEIPLVPLRDMKELKGKYDELVLRENYKDKNLDDFYRIILTDEDDVPDALGKLKMIYKNLMRLDYDNLRTRSYHSTSEINMEQRADPAELFAKFYENRNVEKLSDVQRDFVIQLIEEIRSEL